MTYTRIAAAAMVLGGLAASATAQETQLSLDDAIAIALEAQPGTVEDAEREQFNGRVVAEVEIVNDAGEEIEFIIDLANGEILSVVMDDDDEIDQEDLILDEATFMIPGNAGGGWDTMARRIGQAFTSTGIIDDLSFENRGGNNGGVGLTYMIQNAALLPDTIMLITTQSVYRSLNGTYADSYTDLVPVVAPVGDFATFIVHPESEILSMADLVAAYQSDGSGFAIGGGSAPQEMDHLISALVMQAAVDDPAVGYVSFDAPQPAFAALMSGEVKALTTQYTQALSLADEGVVRIIGVTSPTDFDLPSGVSNMTEQGIPIDFATWIGFFAAPGTDADQIAEYQNAFAELYETDAWEGILSDNGGIAFQLDSDAFAALLQTQKAELQSVIQRLAAQ